MLTCEVLVIPDATSMWNVLLIENHINLNTQIDTKIFARFFADDLNKIKTFVENFIMLNYPDPEIGIKGDIVSYKVKDTAKEDQVIIVF